MENSDYMSEIWKTIYHFVNGDICWDECVTQASEILEQETERRTLEILENLADFKEEPFLPD